jgi:predicted ATPase/class 3 adenylate cyclase
MTSYPTSTSTFLLTDVEDSTALWEQHPQAMRESMARHDALIEAAAAAHQGLLVRPRGEGDSRFAVFEGAVHAVLAVVDIQRELAAGFANSPFPLKVRAGIHTGAADWRDGDYYGSAVNRCARIRGLAHGGQTLLSSAVAELVRDELPSGVELIEMGTHRLKGLSRPETVFQVWISGLSNEFPPLLSADAAPGNLLTPPTPIIGRERELDDVVRLLSPDSVRLVTITGPGGAGKTRLALEVGLKLLNQFPHGVYFVDMAPLTDPGLVPTTIAHTLGLREGGGRPPFDSLKEYLAGKQLLLILDNLEQIIAAAPFAAQLLAAASRVQMLATSRIPLQIRGEQEYPLPTLPAPPATSALSPDELLAYESVRLFVQQAQAARPSFELTAENAPAVVGICRRLDGLPLAIEIAAARIRILTPGAILSRLDQSMKLLVGGAADLPERQQTVRKAIDWSFTLLQPEEQTLFARLSVFVGGFTLESAEAVCNQDNTLDILSGIESLVRNSLVRQVEWGLDEPRFDMLQTIRDYALEKLVESGELPATRYAHALYFADDAAQALGRIQSAEAVTGLARTEADHDNFRAAMTWSLETPGAAGLIARMTPYLSWFWFRHGHFSEGRDWAERGVRATEGDEGESGAMARAAAAMMANWNGDLAQAVEYIETATRLSDAVGIDFNRAACHFFYGIILINMGRHRDAYGHLAFSAELFDQSQYRWMETTAMVHLGNAALGQGHVDQALKYIETAYPIIRQLGDQYQIGWALQNFGEVERVRGNYRKAREYYDQAQVAAREAEAPSEDARLAHNFGYLALHDGDLDEAEASFRRGLDMFRVMVMKRGMCECLAGLAAVGVARGRFDWAAPLLAAAETQLRSYGADWWAGDRVEIERTRAQLREVLGEAEFDRLWEWGQEMSLEAAIAWASGAEG